MTTNLDRARLISERVQLQSVLLAQASVDARVDPAAAPNNLEVQQEHRASFAKSELGKGRVDVRVEFSFRVRPQGATLESDLLLNFKATFLLLYSVPERDSLPDDAFQHFADLNGAYNAWPYWRELVQSVTGRVGLAGFVLPVYRPKVVPVTDAGVVAERPLRKYSGARGMKASKRKH